MLLFVNSVADILFLFFLAILFSIYLAALTDFSTRRLGLSRGLGIVLTLLVTTVVVTLVGLLIVPPVITQFRDLIGSLPDQLSAAESKLAELAEENQLLRRMLRPLLEGGAGGLERPAGDVVQAPRYLDNVLQQVGDFFGGIVPYVFSGIGVAIHTVSVLIMGIYLALKPSVYREGLITMMPPAYRELARDILADLGHTLRAWLVGQGLAMLVLGTFTWVGLRLLDVPYSLAFGVFTGLAAIVPFFGTIVSTLLPALFVISTGGVVKALLVILLGVVVHVFEANVVAPMIFEKQVKLPPVLTILSVLIMGKLLGVVGLLVAVPSLASVMVIGRRIYVHRILEGKGFHRIEEDAPVVISLPTGDGVLVHPSAAEQSVPALLEG